LEWRGVAVKRDAMIVHRGVSRDGREWTREERRGRK
jgi:hypothetical protein